MYHDRAFKRFYPAPVLQRENRAVLCNTLTWFFTKKRDAKNPVFKPFFTTCHTVTLLYISEIKEKRERRKRIYVKV